MTCGQDLAVSAFDPARLSTWRKNNDTGRRAKCNSCWATKVECVVCRKQKPVSAFDGNRLTLWRKHREVSKQAKCISCAAKVPQRATHAQKDTLDKQTLYKCSVCNCAVPAHNFDKANLRQLVETSTLYLAKCGKCAPLLANNPKTMKCNLCTLTKPAHAFSPARQRHRAPATWRCTDCDFQPCVRCGAMPTQPKQKGYMCPRCLFPACACGAPRPPWTQNRVTVKPIWQCDACKK